MNINLTNALVVIVCFLLAVALCLWIAERI
jgi:hypothetical protein